MLEGKNGNLGETATWIKKEREKHHRSENNFIVKLWIAITRKPKDMSTRTYKNTMIKIRKSGQAAMHVSIVSDPTPTQKSD